MWVGVHFGSRGFGHKTASGFLALAQGLELARLHKRRGRIKEGRIDYAAVRAELTGADTFDPYKD